MATLSQVRYDEDNLSEVRVTIILEESSSADAITPWLNDTAVDPAFGMITGWIHVSSLSDIANLTEVKQVRSQLPPVESGNQISSPVPVIQRG